MKINEFIRLFVPPIYYKVKHQLQDKPRQLPPPLPKRKHMGDKMIVIGNGPSLNQTMELYGDILRQSECMMVNFSASTPLFEDIKPSVYVMADPNFVASHDLDVQSAIHDLIDNIVRKTVWPMTIVMPSHLSSWWAIDQFNQNQNITILFDRGGWRELPDDQLFTAFDKNELCPPTYTVLSFCLYISLYWGYKEIFLVGADTSFIHDMYVGQTDNILYTVDTHFYKNEDVILGEIEPEKLGRPFGRTMEQELKEVYYMFYEYNLLNRYALWKGACIYNASAYSMIDCYKRRSLND